MLLITTRW